MPRTPWLHLALPVLVAVGGLASAAHAGLACGDPGAGDCCIPNGTPACDDAFCCEIVCRFDPFCCEVEWDALCAKHQLGLCEGCGDPPGFCPGEGDCCAGNGTPFCNDAECCDAVCAFDPFCCETEWDSICADEAADICDLCGAGCPGDLDDDGDTDSADLNILLGGFGCTGVGAPCAGDLDDDGDTDSADLNILLGGFGCTPPPSDCCAANATPGCDDRACEKIVCAIDTVCCLLDWDALCAEAAQGLCAACDAPPTAACCFANAGDCLNLAEPICVRLDGMWQGEGNTCDIPGICDEPPPLVCPGEGDCCVPNGAPGCQDEACCTLVCTDDPFCCEVEWDGVCVRAAVGHRACGCALP